LRLVLSENKEKYIRTRLDSIIHVARRPILAYFSDEAIGKHHKFEEA